MPVSYAHSHSLIISFSNFYISSMPLSPPPTLYITFVLSFVRSPFSFSLIIFLYIHEIPQRKPSKIMQKEVQKKGENGWAICSLWKLLATAPLAFITWKQRHTMRRSQGSLGGLCRWGQPQKICDQHLFAQPPAFPSIVGSCTRSFWFRWKLKAMHPMQWEHLPQCCSICNVATGKWPILNLSQVASVPAYQPSGLVWDFLLTLFLYPLQEAAETDMLSKISSTTAIWSLPTCW